MPAMGSPGLAHGLQHLETELEDAFSRIQNHLKLLREDFGSDTLATKPDSRNHRQDAFEKVDALGDWLLKDDVMSIPYEGPGALSELSADALHLSAEMLGTSANSHMRLNSHLMELSMRAAESVHVLKKSRNSTGIYAVNAASSYASAGPTTELERCESILHVIPPNSRFRLVWDLSGVLLIILDAFLLPMTMAWSEWEITPMPASNSASSRVLQMFAILSLIFWPCDIMVNFNTAFYVRGFIETRRWEIAKRYAYTWLGFDICVVLLDFAAGFLGQASVKRETWVNMA